MKRFTEIKDAVLNDSKIRTAFILGAGLGTRLRPLTEKRPKPLLPVGGRPLITFAMDHCLSIGIDRFIVNTHHRSEAYDKAFPGGNWRGTPILFRHEPVLLDTGGGLKNIEDLLENDETILVYNGDILSDLSLERLVEAHAAGGREITLALRTEGPLRNVCLDAKGEICDLRGLLGNPGVRHCLFTGIYMVEKRFFRRLVQGRIESVVPVFAGMIREAPGSIASVVIDEGAWQDVGDTEAYLRIRAAVPALRYGKGHATTAAPSTGDRDEPTLQSYAFIRETLGLAAGTRVELAPVGKGGSDRDFFRIAAAGLTTVILMRYGRMYEENDCYAAVASFLRGIDVKVPKICGHDPERRLILMEDLGDTDLYALRDAPWDIRCPLYEKTLAMAARLHAFSPDRLPAGLRLMPGYDRELYQWEHRYFLEECVRNTCRIDLTAKDQTDLKAELSCLAERLLKAALTLIHRDLQSQNIMIHDGEPALIDFQGMRLGSPFYDLGSLLYDPYVVFPQDGRDHLLRFYHVICGSGCPWELFRELFLLASAQRLMQALGAYGFLGLKRAKPHFLAHIPRALENLVAVTAETGALPYLNALAQRCREAVPLSATHFI